jgi:gliding motility-associated lipoprotein GldD
MKVNQLMTRISLLFLLLLTITICGCGSDTDDTIAPKPRTYFRLSFPERKYVQYDSTCPFSFEMPAYASVSPDKNAGAAPCWINVDFPRFQGTLHLSYKEVKGNLAGYLEDTYTLATKHQVKASGIEEQQIMNDTSRVYGLLYNIEGNAASSVQFYLTDSTKHFIRGALYFNAVPNTDSIRPVTDFIRQDIYHLIETFRWKN